MVAGKALLCLLLVGFLLLAGCNDQKIPAPAPDTGSAPPTPGEPAASPSTTKTPDQGTPPKRVQSSTTLVSTDPTEIRAALKNLKDSLLLAYTYQPERQAIGFDSMGIQRQPVPGKPSIVSILLAGPAGTPYTVKATAPASGGNHVMEGKLGDDGMAFEQLRVCAPDDSGNCALFSADAGLNLGVEFVGGKADHLEVYMAGSKKDGDPPLDVEIRVDGKKSSFIDLTPGKKNEVVVTRGKKAAFQSITLGLDSLPSGLDGEEMGFVLGAGSISADAIAGTNLAARLAGEVFRIGIISSGVSGEASCAGSGTNEPVPVDLTPYGGTSIYLDSSLTTGSSTLTHINTEIKGLTGCRQGNDTFIIPLDTTGLPAGNLGLFVEDRGLYRVDHTISARSAPASPCESRCSAWADWQWTDCNPKGKQTGTRTRTCPADCVGADKPKESETMERNCKYNPPTVTLTLDGKPVSEVAADATGFGLSIAYPNRPLDIPIELSLVEPVIPTIKPKLIGNLAQCGSPNQCTVNLDDWVRNIGLVAQPNESGRIPLVVGVNVQTTRISKAAAQIMVNALACQENWSCGEWGAWGSCTSGSQNRSRNCMDAAGCDTTSSRPPVTESQNCQACVENWGCGEWSSWSAWDTCPESGTQSRTRTRTCTDANACGTTASKPPTTETGTQSCSFTPTQQKPEYSSHESSLSGAGRISNLNYSGANIAFDLTPTGGTYGYRILGIPPKSTISVCVTASGALSFFYYPQYHYGFTFTDTTPGCTDIYNKNDWANGVLLHLGDPNPVNVTGHVTVAPK